MKLSLPSLRALAALTAIFTLTSCESGNQGLAPASTSLSHLEGYPAPAQGELTVCKDGTDASFDWTLNGSDQAGFGLVGGNCTTLYAFSGGAGPVTIQVTENVPANTTLDSIVTYSLICDTQTSCRPIVKSVLTGTNTAGSTFYAEDGRVFVFYNSVLPPPIVDGRMTGGGKQIQVGVANITRGFTVHCDITLSNNIEINWEGYSWHLDKPIDTAQCFDDPTIIQDPPKAPLDKFVGTATGRLNGVDGSHLDFTFIDAGEPGRNDMAALKITAPDGTVVLDVPLSNLDKGNIQAHFDQPHK